LELAFLSAFCPASHFFFSILTRIAHMATIVSTLVRFFGGYRKAGRLEPKPRGLRREHRYLTKGNADQSAYLLGKRPHRAESMQTQVSAGREDRGGD
jgi:hypothetical protein